MDNGQDGTQAEDRLSKLLKDYHAAKSDFDRACKEASRALAAREQSAKQLKVMSEEVQQAVQSGLYDPTSPKTLAAEKPYVEYSQQQEGLPRR